MISEQNSCSLNHGFGVGIIIIFCDFVNEESVQTSMYA